MPINVKCPYCEKIISARDELAGRKVDCPSCLTQIDLPTKGEAGKEISSDELASKAGPPSFYIDACPHCGKVVSAPHETRWARGRCPNCKKLLGAAPEEGKAEPEAEKEKPRAETPKTPASAAATRSPAHEKRPPAGFVAGVF